MAYQDKVYVCFDGEGDTRYFQLMKTWKQNDNTPFSFLNAQDLKHSYETILAATTKRRLRDKLINSKVFVVLIGQKTKFLHRVERWEMEIALKLNLQIIAVNLNGLRKVDKELCPSIFRDKLVLHISFNAEILQYALENWPESFQRKKDAGSAGAFYYNDKIYSSLGL
jgi:hypothetical protein